MKIIIVTNILMILMGQMLKKTLFYPENIIHHSHNSVKQAVFMHSHYRWGNWGPQSSDNSHLRLLTEEGQRLDGDMQVAYLWDPSTFPLGFPSEASGPCNDSEGEGESRCLVY